ncbi:MAG: hypothetical protein U5K55_04850 [Aliarcobacter sp.]|nr:hypothetical protein [Aliarcobacter sp.]
MSQQIFWNGKFLKKLIIFMEQNQMNLASKIDLFKNQKSCYGA